MTTPQVDTPEWEEAVDKYGDSILSELEAAGDDDTTWNAFITRLHEVVAEYDACSDEEKYTDKRRGLWPRQKLSTLLSIYLSLHEAKLNGAGIPTPRMVHVCIVSMDPYRAFVYYLRDPESDTTYTFDSLDPKIRERFPRFCRDMKPSGCTVHDLTLSGDDRIQKYTEAGVGADQFEWFPGMLEYEKELEQGHPSDVEGIAELLGIRIHQVPPTAEMCAECPARDTCSERVQAGDGTAPGPKEVM